MSQASIDARDASVARPITADSTRLFRRAVLVLIGLLLLVRVIGMAIVPLLDSTEARYGETGRIMAELNDWITPWFDYGVPFWGKPPLSFWVTAASFKAFGVSEFTARLPHLAISLFIVSLAGWLAARRDRDCRADVDLDRDAAPVGARAVGRGGERGDGGGDAGDLVRPRRRGD